MNNYSIRHKGDFIDCEICLKEIPISESRSEEATDYVTHFFGLKCYAMWKAQPQNALIGNIKQSEWNI